MKKIMVTIGSLLIILAVNTSRQIDSIEKLLQCIDKCTAYLLVLLSQAHAFRMNFVQDDLPA